MCLSWWAVKYEHGLVGLQVCCPGIEALAERHESGHALPQHRPDLRILLSFNPKPSTLGPKSQVPTSQRLNVSSSTKHNPITCGTKGDPGRSYDSPEQERLLVKLSGLFVVVAVR
jgi:hypothetical protein